MAQIRQRVVPTKRDVSYEMSGKMVLWSFFVMMVVLYILGRMSGV